MADPEKYCLEKRMQNVIGSGDQLLILKTMLEMLAERFDKCAPRDSAGISRQMQVVMDQIADINDAGSADEDGMDAEVDELNN